jgi:ornithine cyclodeaminase/alanine dehydrogenase-like protein (mu-crystallin family)
LLLTRADVERLLDLGACIDAVERAFRLAGEGKPVPSAMLGLEAADGGFHVKAALTPGERSDGGRYFAAKVNANFPGNPARHGLPTIQGLLVLADAVNGAPLAVMDSMAVTIRRTAAATAVAARHLALPGARSVTIVGCGAQALAHLEALCLVRPVERACAVDISMATAHSFAQRATAALGIPVTAERELARATARSEIVVTATPSHAAFLGREHVAPGVFVAAVGADNQHKEEIMPSLLAASAVITDSTAQCAAIGDLRHAVAVGAMRVDDVRAELASVVVDVARGRRDASEVVIYDSTGVAFQDVVAAALVYERAVRERAGTSFGFGGMSTMSGPALSFARVFDGAPLRMDRRNPRG